MAPVDSGELQAVLANDLGRRSGSRSRRIGVVPEPKMSVARSVAEVLSEHVTLEVEGIDRMYLNVYVPGWQREQGVATFFRFHRGHQFVSGALMDPISKTFVAAPEGYARREKIPIVQFRKGQRKDGPNSAGSSTRPKELSSSGKPNSCPFPEDSAHC
jgi:hypothetical protein